MLLKKQWFNEEIKGEIRKHAKINENGNTVSQNYGMYKSISKRELHSFLIWWLSTKESACQYRRKW